MSLHPLFQQITNIASGDLINQIAAANERKQCRRCLGHGYEARRASRDGDIRDDDNVVEVTCPVCRGDGFTERAA